MTCDYCDEGNAAVDGWHTYYASTPVDEVSYRVPCSTYPPSVAPIVTDPSRLTFAEKQALLRVGAILGAISLDLEGGVQGGDYLP